MPTASLPEVMKVGVDRALSEIHTCLPGRIESYDHTKQRAQVKPLIKKKYRDGQVAALPVIPDVPVVFPRAKDFSFTFPLEPGDFVMLHFSERSLELFLTKGGDQEPGDTRKFDLTDAIAVPGLYPFSEESLSENNEDVLTVFKENKIRITGGGNLEMEVAADKVVNVGGNCTINVAGDANIDVGGSTVLSSGGSTTINASDCTINCDTQINGDLNVSGEINAGGDINSGGDISTASASISGGGNITNQGTIQSTGDVTGNGISLSGHTHGGVQPGGASTGPPQ